MKILPDRELADLKKQLKKISDAVNGIPAADQSEAVCEAISSVNQALNKIDWLLLPIGEQKKILRKEQELEGR